MSFRWPAGLSLVALLALPLQAQHEGHDMMNMKMDSAEHPPVHVMLQAIPLVTRAAPGAGGVTTTQLALTQVLAMVRASFWSNHAELDGALNGEGLTMPAGELNTGASGEGFVDKRHPHTYVHELMLTLQNHSGPVGYSVTAGRGFAPFGTDDPMMRPLVKFPLNHHLAQILERGSLIGAARVGPTIIEGATFGGDEPTSPSSLPRLNRFGDSWAVRSTLIPVTGLEVQGSYARVASPEEVTGFGLDQRKRSLSARGISSDGRRYLLAEWARTVERDHSRNVDAFGYESALVEGAVRAGPLGFALRLEQTERPEEERLSDPFRTPRPASDLSIGGITRWRAATMQVDAPAVTAGTVLGVPFIEIARLGATPVDDRTLLTPQRLYGTSRFWMLTAGVRVRAGGAHARMGRYGVALDSGPAIGTLAGDSSPAHMH